MIALLFLILSGGEPQRKAQPSEREILAHLAGRTDSSGQQPPLRFLWGLAISLLLAITLVSVNSCGRTEGGAGSILIKFGSVNPPSNPIMKTFRFIEREIERRSGGEMQVVIYDSGRLGGETDNVERLRLGTMEMTDVASSVLGNFEEDFFVFDLPFLFDSKEHQNRVLNGPVGQDLLRELEPIGLKGMAFYYIGTRNIYTKRPVKAIEDLSGLKIRVMESKIMLQTLNSLGTHAIPMSFSELYNALQQDVVDGAENNPFQYLASGHVDLCPYFIRTEHFMIPEVLLVSKQFYDRLSPKHRAILGEVARDSRSFHNRTWSALEQETYQKLSEAGATVIDVDKGPYRQRVEGIYEAFEARYGSEIIDRIRRAGKKSVGKGQIGEVPVRGTTEPEASVLLAQAREGRTGKKNDSENFTRDSSRMGQREEDAPGIEARAEAGEELFQWNQ